MAITRPMLEHPVKIPQPLLSHPLFSTRGWFRPGWGGRSQGLTGCQLMWVGSTRTCWTSLYQVVGERCLWKHISTKVTQVQNRKRLCVLAKLPRLFKLSWYIRPREGNVLLHYLSSALYWQSSQLYKGNSLRAQSNSLTAVDEGCIWSRANKLIDVIPEHKFKRLVDLESS